MVTKRALRQYLHQQRMMLTPAEIASYSACIAQHVCALPSFRVSQTIMVYMALPQEVQTHDIIDRAWQLRKRIAVPVVRGRRLLAVELPRERARLQRGPFGVVEPCEPHTVIATQTLGCVLIPGVAFDTTGGRLGFGQGYYDRFLALLPVTTYRCGLAFRLQVRPGVPQEPHDIRMHGIVTEQGHCPCQTLPPALSTMGQ